MIDPKTFIGDPAFEPAAYLCNPIPELIQENKPRKIIANRVSICSAQLNIDAQRIADRLYVKSVLCWAWSLEDNLDPYFHLIVLPIPKLNIFPKSKSGSLSGPDL